MHQLLQVAPLLDAREGCGGSQSLGFHFGRGLPRRQLPASDDSGLLLPDLQATALRALLGLSNLFSRLCPLLFPDSPLAVQPAFCQENWPVDELTQTAAWHPGPYGKCREVVTWQESLNLRGTCRNRSRFPQKPRPVAGVGLADEGPRLAGAASSLESYYRSATSSFAHSRAGQLLPGKAHATALR